ncbi:hydrolase [Dehalogenimonas etheniformans]|uniref:Hydrolase n=1 Tax=Dehalogenimonas etheniformans TaxID=1536648 RepID=A0A2P5P610_9CHLR|nr:hydrolase [Dehalogenimonas etheniformans]PPD57732.1 hydrolase [Dehalogenimonas etheniformans]QNT76073.1 hydrolase [Dehalogenimonas etheniformans]
MLEVKDTVLLVIDVQEKLFPVMFDKEILLSNLQKLVKSISLLEIPIIYTEQNPAGLGRTIPELIGGYEAKPVSKFHFSCCNEAEFNATLSATQRKQVLVCGIESHICVYQTSMDLLLKDFEVHLVTDCVSSRTSQNKDLALRRLASEGAKLTGVEMALFELLRSSKSGQFKAISSLIKG